MQSCRATLMSLLMRIGVGLLIVGVIVLIMSFFANEPQTAEEVTGDTIHLAELIFIFATHFFGTPLKAAVALLFGGMIMVLIALIMATFDKESVQQRE